MIHFKPIENRDKAFPERKASTHCFYCYLKLGYPRIVREGYDATIELHPECVVQMTVSMYADLKQFQSEGIIFRMDVVNREQNHEEDPQVS